MYSMWLSEDQQRVWRNYLAMSAGLQIEMNRQLQRDCGLSLADYDVLVALSELAACRVNELGDRLGWEQSRLSHQLRRMRDRGLIERRGADDDRRGATVELTEAGRSALASSAQGHVDLVRNVVFDGTGDAQLRALDRWTSQVLARLGRSPA
ncbi:MarR family transcriptional regulator [Mycolicibacterium sp. P9-64]|uniref:MarR family winged helix-turn-helix transcriptional regulator n=1 Tax=Mycolicibacterium sp. P9-64 TaxID=2024612 RepID=UPI0011EFF033|nr:MarR family winged helix-turn-helix transcriptional regulator [Mycolicibacterium sp. P9-64]KAA0074810.1 MarR family transcriptional regulator [Mycolicibacterium sp. P9-64]